MSQLLITSSQSPGQTTLVVQGDVDSATVAQFREAMDDLGADGATVVIDLGGVPFIDSSGLGALVRASRAAQAKGATFRVVNASRAVTRAAEHAGLADHLGMANA